MKPSRTFENRLESAGTTLRDRPSLVDQIMAEVRRVAVPSPTSSSEPSRAPGETRQDR